MRQWETRRIHQENVNIWGAPFSVSTTVNGVDAEEAIAVIPPLGNGKTGLGKKEGGGDKWEMRRIIRNTSRKY